MIVDTSQPRILLDVSQLLDVIQCSSLASLPFGARFVEGWSIATESGSRYWHSYKWSFPQLYEAGARPVPDGDVQESSRACNVCCQLLRPAGVKKDFGQLYKCSNRNCTVGWWGKTTSLPADQETRSARKSVADVLKVLQAEGFDKLTRATVPIGCLNRLECSSAKLKLIDLAAPAYRRLGLAELLHCRGLIDDLEMEFVSAKAKWQEVRRVRASAEVKGVAQALSLPTRLIDLE